MKRQALGKLIISSSCVLVGILLKTLLGAAELRNMAVLAEAIGSIAAGNAASSIDTLNQNSFAENSALTKVVGKAIAKVIALAAKQQPTDICEQLQQIADYTEKNWLEIAQQEVMMITHPELLEANLPFLLTLEENRFFPSNILPAQAWASIFIRLKTSAFKEKNSTLERRVVQQVCEQLNNTFSTVLWQTFKEDFAEDSKVFNELTLNLLIRIKSGLEEGRANAATQLVKLNENTWQQCLEILQTMQNRLNETNDEQQKYFNQISDELEATKQISYKLYAELEDTKQQLLLRIEGLEKAFKVLSQNLPLKEGGYGFCKNQLQELKNKLNLVTEYKNFHDIFHPLHLDLSLQFLEFDNYELKIFDNHPVLIDLENIQSKWERLHSNSLLKGLNRIIEARNSFIEANEQGDVEKAREELKIIDSYLCLTLSFLNEKLKGVVQQLPLNSLINVLEDLQNSNLSTDNYTCKQIKQVILNIGSLQKYLNNLIKQHDVFQDYDDSINLFLAKFRDLPEKTTLIQKFKLIQNSWNILPKSGNYPDSTTLSQKRYNTISNILIQREMNLKNQLDDEIKNYCRDCKMNFYRVDSSLKKFCNQQLYPLYQELDNFTKQLETP